MSDEAGQCREFRGMLSALIDRELDRAEVERLRAHLMGCETCCRECALLCCLDAAVARAALPEGPAGLWDRVRAEAGLPGEMPDETTPECFSEVLTLGEAASLLRVSVEELSGQLDSIPHFNLKEHVRFRRASLEGWMAVQESRGSMGVRVAAGGQVVDFVRAKARLTRMGRA